MYCFSFDSGARVQYQPASAPRRPWTRPRHLRPGTTVPKVSTARTVPQYHRLVLRGQYHSTTGWYCTGSTTVPEVSPQCSTTGHKITCRTAVREVSTARAVASLSTIR
eukprot:3301299-Rhodomonas_salina.2